jgi:tol-pal system protein YbgF
LRLFIEKNPKDKNFGDANYYLGEVYYKRRQYKEAAQYYLKVSTDFPKAVKNPNAHLRLGQSFYAFGDRESACTAYGEMSRKFPTLATSLKTALDNEVKRAKC